MSNELLEKMKEVNGKFKERMNLRNQLRRYILNMLAQDNQVFAKLRRGFTQQWIADRVRVCQATISFFETGKLESIDDDTVATILDVYLEIGSGVQDASDDYRGLLGGSEIR